MSDDVLNLIKMIKLKPGLYIGSKSLVKMRSFLDGYFFAMRCNNIEYNSVQYNNFNTWISKKYNIRTSELWDTYLLKVTNNEEDAFDLFFEELEGFMKENNFENSKIK